VVDEMIRRVLPGSTIHQKGDVGTLVLTRQVAKALDLL
jgi:hypothetical protein